MNKTPIRQAQSASTILNGIERWAEHCYVLRETGALRCGRLDGLLVPRSWEAKMPLGIAGVEVKVSRGDFLRGLNSGQFARYDERLTGLYVATNPSVCKTSEIPAGIGHLVCGIRPGYGPICICRRRPTWKAAAPFSQEDLWRVVWDLFDQHARSERNQEKERHRLAAILSGKACAIIGRKLAEIERAAVVEAHGGPGA